MASGVPGNIDKINAKVEGDHVLGSRISKAAKRSRESGQVVYKPWITHSAHGYGRKQEELDGCFPNGRVGNVLSVKKTSFAAGHDISFSPYGGRDVITPLLTSPSNKTEGFVSMSGVITPLTPLWGVRGVIT